MCIIILCRAELKLRGGSTSPSTKMVSLECDDHSELHVGTLPMKLIGLVLEVYIDVLRFLYLVSMIGSSNLIT